MKQENHNYGKNQKKYREKESQSRKYKNKRQHAAIFLSMLLSISILSGCGSQAVHQAVPELLEPVEITLTGKKVVRGDIQDIEAYKGSVKSDCVSYSFTQGTYVEESECYSFD